MKIRELLESHEAVHAFFKGQNLDHDVRLAAHPGEVEAGVEAPAEEVKEGEQDNG